MKDKIKFNILAIISIIFFCVAISPKTLQNDTYYSIAIGEQIMQTGIDGKDHFSWHEDLPYEYPHWGYDVMISLIYSNFGMTGIYVSTCILSIILGLTLYGVNCKISKNNIVSFIVTIGSIYLLRDYIAARAQLVTFTLFILTIFFIESYLQSKKKRYLFGLVIIPIIIANIHVAVWPFYFILYLPYIGEYLFSVLADLLIYHKIAVNNLKNKIEKLKLKGGKQEQITKLENKLKKVNEKVDIIKQKRESEKKNAYKINIVKNSNTKWLIIIMIICILTGLLTPLGDTPYTYLYKTMQGNTTENINEHLPMTLVNHQDAFCLIILYLALLTFTKAKIRLSDLFMIAGLAYLMLLSRRQMTMLVIIGSIMLCRLLVQVIHLYTKKDIKQLYKTATTKSASFIILAIILICSLLLIKDKKGTEYINTVSYPVEACDYILDNLDVQNMKIYNEYNYGSYMLFRGIPVFIDSRADLYAPEFNTKTGDAQDGKDIFMDFINVSSIGTYYDDVFDNYDITHVITTQNSKMNMLIGKRNDNKYIQLYADDNFVLYEINEED